MRAALITLVLSGALAEAGWSATCETPEVSEAEWPTATPAEAGFDAALLCSIDETLARSPEMKVHAVVVVRHGKLVHETYQRGTDYKGFTELGVVDHNASVRHDMRSISKSVVSLLVGIALDRKLIKSIDEPLFAFYPDSASLRTARKDAIRLRHLLAMTSGFAWEEEGLPYDDPGNSWPRMIDSVNPYRFVLEQPLRHEPGARWNYSGGDSQLLGGILQRTSGKFLAEFAKEALFEPLGIIDFEWIKMAANGEAAADSGLRLRPRDMAKIGQLVLDKGMWKGQRIVSQEWIDESTRTHTTGVDPIPSIGYGYQWWTDHGKVGDHEISWVCAKGYGGQRLYIVPKYDLVVAITAGFYGEKSHDWISFDILDKFILAAIRK